MSNNKITSLRVSSELQAWRKNCINDELERLNKARSGLDAVNEVLTAIMIADESNDDLNWPLKNNGFVRGGLYSTLSMIADSIDATTKRISELTNPQ